MRISCFVYFACAKKDGVKMDLLLSVLLLFSILLFTFAVDTIDMRSIIKKMNLQERRDDRVMLFYLVWWDTVRAFFSSCEHKVKKKRKEGFFLAMCMTLRHLRHRGRSKIRKNKIKKKACRRRDRLGNALFCHFSFSYFFAQPAWIASMTDDSRRGKSETLQCS
jgi:hypothetical protein